LATTWYGKPIDTTVLPICFWLYKFTVLPHWSKLAISQTEDGEPVLELATSQTEDGEPVLELATSQTVDGEPVFVAWLNTTWYSVLLSLFCISNVGTLVQHEQGFKIYPRL